MAIAIVARKFIDGGVHEPGTKIKVTEARLAELVRMGLVTEQPEAPAEVVQTQTGAPEVSAEVAETEPTEPTDPATNAAKKGKK